MITSTRSSKAARSAANASHVFFATFRWRIRIAATPERTRRLVRALLVAVSRHELRPDRMPRCTNAAVPERLASTADQGEINEALASLLMERAENRNEGDFGEW